MEEAAAAEEELEGVGVGSREPEPGRARGPGRSRSYLVVARDGWLAPSGIRGSGASGERRRPLPRLFPASVAAATTAAAAPTPEGGLHSPFPPPGPDRPPARGARPDSYSRSAPPRARRLPRPPERPSRAASPSRAAAPAARPALCVSLTRRPRPPRTPALARSPGP